MITIIHGDDITSSRNFYFSLQKGTTENFDGEKTTPAALQEALQSTGLFGDEKDICIENFFSKRKASKEMDAIIELLKTAPQATTIILWESKELPKKTTSLFSGASVKLFAIPKSLFSFLDGIKPGNTKPMLSLYHQTLTHTDAEMVLVMLIRQTRILLALLDDSADTIEEVKRMAPWQKSKLLTQARLFSNDQLQTLHSQLFDIEVKSKTGGLSLPLPQTIDFLLAAI